MTSRPSNPENLGDPERKGGDPENFADSDIGLCLSTDTLAKMNPFQNNLLQRTVPHTSIDI